MISNDSPGSISTKVTFNSKFSNRNISINNPCDRYNQSINYLAANSILINNNLWFDYFATWKNYNEDSNEKRIWIYQLNYVMVSYF